MKTLVQIGAQRRNMQNVLPPPLKMVTGYEGLEESKIENALVVHLVFENDHFTRGWTSRISHWGVLRK